MSGRNQVMQHVGNGVKVAEKTIVRTGPITGIANGAMARDSAAHDTICHVSQTLRSGAGDRIASVKSEMTNVH